MNQRIKEFSDLLDKIVKDKNQPINDASPLQLVNQQINVQELNQLLSDLSGFAQDKTELERG